MVVGSQRTNNISKNSATNEAIKRSQNRLCISKAAIVFDSDVWEERGILKSDESCISNPKSEISNWTSRSSIRCRLSPEGRCLIYIKRETGHFSIHCDDDSVGPSGVRRLRRHILAPHSDEIFSIFGGLIGQAPQPDVCFSLHCSDRRRQCEFLGRAGT